MTEIFSEDFEEYKKRITEHYRYRYEDRKELIILLLWEILEVLWEIGRHITGYRP